VFAISGQHLRVDGLEVVHVKPTESLPSTVSASIKNLKSDQLFVLGDNSSNSYDSRMFGVISTEVVKAQARLILYSKNTSLNNLDERWLFPIK